MKTINKDQLVHDLRRLGVRQDDCVMLHSSLSRLGRVDGGAAAVVEALLEAMGTGGTLITPAFTQGAWTEHLAMPDCRGACPQTFCPSQWPSHEGAIPNAALAREGRLRSCHPTHSWVANGARAEEVLRNNVNSPTPCGRGNPFEALCDADSCIITLGVGVNTVTLWHHFEFARRRPSVCWSDAGHRPLRLFRARARAGRHGRASHGPQRDNPRNGQNSRCKTVLDART